jgi:hypothetical protein
MILAQSNITVHVGKSGLFRQWDMSTPSVLPSLGATGETERSHVWFPLDTARVTLFPENPNMECWDRYLDRFEKRSR